MNNLDYKYFLPPLFLSALVGILISCSQVNRNQKWHEESGYRWTKIDPGNGKTGFKKLNSEKIGINFKNHLPDSLIIKNRILLDGSGVATGDINNDGRPDIYFCQLDGPNKLYENMGNMHFKDITDSAGIAQKGYYSTGAVFADIDGDTDLDLLVTSLNNKNNIYLNDGKGHFTRDKNSGLGKSRGSTSIALADIDGDGDLDLYITNYRQKSARDVFNPKKLSWQNTVIKEGDKYELKPQFKSYYTLLHQKQGRPVRRKIGRIDELYINQGGIGKKWKGYRKIKSKNLGRHFLSSAEDPQGLKPDWGLTAKFHDINGDGLPDLYVCNDYWTPDRLWINQGNGIFKSADEKSIRNFSYSAMSVAFSDINGDGSSDIFVSEMLSPIHQRQLRQSGSETFSSGPGSFLKRPQYNQNSLYLNRGDTTFAEIANFSGLAASGWSWASKFIDVDLDGAQDLIVNTGNLFDLLDMDTQYQTQQEIMKGSVKDQSYLLEYPSLKLVNKIYRNNGDLTFTDYSKKWGFNNKDVSQGMATADLDNDGDLDIINNRLKQKTSIYENTVTAPRIEVKLKGLPPNTQAIGAKLTLTGGAKPQRRQVSSGGGYESGSQPVEMFAANGSNSLYHLAIRWPSGAKTTLDSLKANRIYEIDEPESEGGKAEPSENNNGKVKTIFKDVSGKMSYSHHDDLYPDFKIQPLLPERLSQEGPGMAWIDYNGDGNEDLWITSGKGGTTGILKYTGKGTYRSISLPDISYTASGDQTSIVGWSTQKSTVVVIGSANFEQKTARVPSAYIYNITSTGHISKQSIPGVPSTTGPLAAADYDGDGDVDLFIGGRSLPYFYPANATSRLYKNEDGNFILDQKNAKAFKKVGMVTSAVFSDIDGDGDSDLILATEWGPIKIFRNDNGLFHNVTAKWGMNKFYGWWKGLTVGDFNNDGRMDIVATNLGNNNSYKVYKNHPLKMYYDDFNGDHHLDIIESHYDSTLQGYVPRRRAYAFNSEVPSVVQNVKDNTDYAHSTLYDLLRGSLKMIDYKKINTLKSMVFINNGSSFKGHPLPTKAQLSTAFNAGVADINNDGNEDIFLSQNFFALPSQTPQMDAGRGLLLKGNGKGNFKAISGNKSGLKIYGEQRGAAFSDFNKDGRVDLAVSQNDAPVKLYLNQTPTRGYRIRLSGPKDNKNGINSSIRLVYRDGSKGPRREILAGSGYWSQNSPVQIMGAAKKVAKIEIDWFDGTKQFVNVSPNKKDYTIIHK